MKTQSLISFVTLALFASSSLANPVPIPGSIGYKESWRASRDVNEEMQYKRLQYRQAAPSNSPDIAGTAQTEVSSVKGALQGAAAGGANPVVGLMGNFRRDVGPSGSAVNDLLTKGGSDTTSSLGVTSNIPNTDVGTLSYEASEIQGDGKLVGSSKDDTPMTIPFGTTESPMHIPVSVGVDDGQDGKPSVSKSLAGIIPGGGSKSGVDMTTTAGGMKNRNPLLQTTQPFGLDDSSIGHDPSAIEGDFSAISDNAPGLQNLSLLTNGATTPDHIANPLHDSALGSSVGNSNMTPENINQDVNRLVYSDAAHEPNTGFVQSENPLVAGLGSTGATDDPTRADVQQVTGSGLGATALSGGGANFLGAASSSGDANPLSSFIQGIFSGGKSADSPSSMSSSPSTGGSGTGNLMDNHSGFIPSSGSSKGLLGPIGTSPSPTGDKSDGGIISFISGLFNHGSSSSSPSPDIPQGIPAKAQDDSNQNPSADGNKSGGSTIPSLPNVPAGSKLGGSTIPSLPDVPAASKLGGSTIPSLPDAPAGSTVGGSTIPSLPDFPAGSKLGGSTIPSLPDFPAGSTLGGSTIPSLPDVPAASKLGGSTIPSLPDAPAGSIPGLSSGDSTSPSGLDGNSPSSSKGVNGLGSDLSGDHSKSPSPNGSSEKTGPGSGGLSVSLPIPVPSDKSGSASLSLPLSVPTDIPGSGSNGLLDPGSGSPHGNSSPSPSPSPAPPTPAASPSSGAEIPTHPDLGMSSTTGSPPSVLGNDSNRPSTPGNSNTSKDPMRGSGPPNANAGPTSSNSEPDHSNLQGSTLDQGPPSPGAGAGLNPSNGDAPNGSKPSIGIPSVADVPQPSIPALDSIAGNAGTGDNGGVQVAVGTGGGNTDLASSSHTGTNGLHFGPGPAVISPSFINSSNSPTTATTMSGGSSTGPKDNGNAGPKPPVSGNTPTTSPSIPLGPGPVILSNPYAGYPVSDQWGGSSPYPSMFPYQYIDGQGWVAPDGSMVPTGSIFPGLTMSGASPFTSKSGVVYQYMPGKGWVGSDGSVFPFQYVNGQGWFGSTGGVAYGPNGAPSATNGFSYGPNIFYGPGTGALSSATGGVVKRSESLMDIDGATVDSTAVSSYLEGALDEASMVESRWFKSVPLNDAMSAEPVPSTITTAEDAVTYPLNARRGNSGGDNANGAAAAGGNDNGNNNAGQNGNENGNNNGNGGGNESGNRGNNANLGNQGEQYVNGANINGPMANNGNNGRNGANGNVRAHANQGAGGADRYNYEMTDLQALNYLLTLEEFETAFYEEALQRFSEEDFTNVGYPRWVRPRYEQILSHERVHKEFLQSAITSAGQNYVEPCNYELSNVNDPRNFVEFSEAVQSIITSAYVGILRYFNERSYITAGASILAVEARQAAWINSAVRHKNPWNSAFETALTPSQVYTLLSNFFDFQSLTEQNRALLPVSIWPAPRLTLAPRLLPGQQGEVSFPYPSLNEHECLYVVFLTGAANIVAPLIDQHNGHYYVEIPLELEGAGTVYVVLIRGSDNIGDVSVSDQTTVAGPAIAEFPYNAEGKRGSW